MRRYALQERAISLFCFAQLPQQVKASKALPKRLPAAIMPFKGADLKTRFPSALLDFNYT
jgi:hypothetical protein